MAPVKKVKPDTQPKTAAWEGDFFLIAQKRGMKPTQAKISMLKFGKAKMRIRPERAEIKI
jgi:hypothetical protein